MVTHISRIFSYCNKRYLIKLTFCLNYVSYSYFHLQSIFFRRHMRFAFVYGLEINSKKIAELYTKATTECLQRKSTMRRFKT